MAMLMKITELLQSLSDGQVQYVLVGGLAVQLHGFLRSTFDIDLVLAMNDENLVRFIAVANRYGLVPTIPVPIDSLRNTSQIDQWHRESPQGSTRYRGTGKDQACKSKGSVLTLHHSTTRPGHAGNRSVRVCKVKN